MQNYINVNNYPNFFIKRINYSQFSYFCRETKKEIMIRKPFLLAPAGDWESLTAAVNNGADEVYFGVEKLNMRSKAKNFTLNGLSEVTGFCRKNNVKTQLTVNSIIFENEFADLYEILNGAKTAGIDSVVCWDLSVIQMCRELDIPFCVSTQASISNSSAALFYKSLGAQRIVLARECSLAQIKEIRKKVDIEIETFIHGAMCVALSGRCFMSHEVFGKSGNRGECLQPCRREYEIVDKDEKFSLVIGDAYVLSPKDLCTVEFLDKLIEAGIDAFKIEGRKRSPEYIAKTVSVYRAAIDEYFSGGLDKDKKARFVVELAKVYNRGFSNGFYLGEPDGEDFADSYGSVATAKKEYLGKVINYYKKPKIAFVKIEAGELSAGDSVYIIGKTTGAVEISVDRIIREEIEVQFSGKGTEVTFFSSELVRPGDKVYKIIKKTF